MKLKLNKQIIENKQLSHEAIIVYAGIVSSYKCDCNEVLTNKNMLNYYLTQSRKIPRRFEENLRKGLQELLNKGVIVCKEKIGIDYYFDFKNIKLEEKDKFIFVDFQDIRKIMISDYQNKGGLLRLYLCMLGTFISKNHVQDIRNPEKYNNIIGMMSQKYLCDVTGISSRSIVEYIKALEQLELIYVSRCSFMFKDKKGNVKQHNNIYGRYVDKDLIDEFAQIRYNMFDDLHKVKSATATNNARSLMQKYNRLKNDIKYDNKTVASIYEYICKYNEKYPKKAKDLKPFEKYGYRIEKTN